MTTPDTWSLAKTRKPLSVMTRSVFWLSFWITCTVLPLSSPVMVTTPSCRGLIEVVGHQRASRASIVGRKRRLLARRFMIGSTDARGGLRGEGTLGGPARLGGVERPSAVAVIG